MRVLLDEQLPRRLARELVGHDVRTTQQQGWAGIGTGELLRHAAATGFDVFVTGDQNLPFQQNLGRSRIAVIVLIAPINSVAIEDLRPLLPKLLTAIRRSRPGKMERVS